MNINRKKAERGAVFMQEDKKIDWEDRRGTVRNIAALIALIVLVFFLMDGFAGNPLEGTWKNDELGVSLTIGKKDSAVLEWQDYDEVKSVGFTYELDRKEKQITFQKTTEAAAKIGSGKMTDAQIEDAAYFSDTFNYSVDGKNLVLSEWDFGEQLSFTKTK